MEGNSLGPKTCKALSKLFRESANIRHIDIEGNDLTCSGKDKTGIKELALSLEYNESVLWLNLNSTNLDAEAGGYLEKMLEKNHTIIMLDIANNPNLEISQVR